MAALSFKIERDQYYRDVVIDYDSMNDLPERSTNVSSRLKFFDCDIAESEINATNNEGFPLQHCSYHPSFFARLPNEQREVEEIRAFLDNVDSSHVHERDCPSIGTTPVNEYNTEGLLDMEFPTLLPSGDVDWLQARICSDELHEYALHILIYYD